MRHVWLIVLGLSLLGTGCTSDECSRTDDCFAGEVCSDGSCVLAKDENNANNVNNVNNRNNVNNVNNVNNANNLNNANNTNQVTEGPCLIDPFDSTCTPDDGDVEYLSLDESIGCFTGDDLVKQEKTFTSEICAREENDRFDFTIVPCDTLTFVLELEFKPDERCVDNSFEVDWLVQSRRCQDGDEGTRCEVKDDGTIVAEVLVQPDRSIATGKLTVTPLIENMVEFGYSFTVRVR